MSTSVICPTVSQIGSEVGDEMDEEEIAQYQELYLQQEEANICEAIRYTLNKFGFVKNNANEEAVWEAHKQVLINYVKPLYESLQRTPFPHFLKKVGLTDALPPKILSKRLFHVVRRMTIDRKAQQKNGRIPCYKFPIHDDADGKQAFIILNTALVNWVSEVLGSQTFPPDLPTWTDRRFQIYLGYEALYFYLRSINYDLAATKIEPFDFYDGVRTWLKHPPGTSNEPKREKNTRKREKPNAIELTDCQWTQVLGKAVKNPITYLALFSKAVHLSVFVGNANKAEEAETQNPSKRQRFFNNTLDNERKHLEPEDDEEVLENVSEGIKAFEQSAKAKPEELGKARRGIIQQKWCNSSLCRFLGLAYCQDIYGIAQEVFPHDKELQKTVRDILVKPLSSDTKEHNKILALLEGGRNAKVVDDIMTLVDKATFPDFREIWERLDKQEITDDD